MQLWKRLQYLHPNHHLHFTYRVRAWWPNASLRTRRTIVYSEASEVAARLPLAAKVWLIVGNVQRECRQRGCTDLSGLSGLSGLNQMEPSFCIFLYMSIWEKAHRKCLYRGGYILNSTDEKKPIFISIRFLFILFFAQLVLPERVLLIFQDKTIFLVFIPHVCI